MPEPSVASQEVIDHNLARALDLFGIHLEGVKRWGEYGVKRPGSTRRRD